MGLRTVRQVNLSIWARPSRWQASRFVVSDRSHRSPSILQDNVVPIWAPGLTVIRTFTYRVTRSNLAAMSDDEADPELLALLREHLQGKLNIDEEPETGVLRDAEYVYDNAIDVALDMRPTKNAAEVIFAQMQQKNYTTAKWSEPELHPKTRDETTVAFIFTMDLLNFSFWSEKSESERFAVLYRDKRWTGYWSLVAALQRALDEGWFETVSFADLEHH
jgi:hypothetical protein